MKKLNRREFTRIALGGSVPGATRRVSAQGKLSLSSLPTINGVLIGSSTFSLSNLPLEEAIKNLAAIGFREAELHPRHIEPAFGPQFGRGAGGGRAPLTPEQAATAAEARKKMRQWRLTVPLEQFEAAGKKFQDAGILLYAYNMNFRDDFTDPEIERAFEMTKALGCNLMTPVGSNELFRRLDPFAKKHKVRVGLHNEARGPRTAEEFEAVRKGLSEYIGITLDIGHFVAAGSDPVSFVAKYHDDILKMHIKDRTKTGGPDMPFGEGDTPIKEVLLMLRDNKYRIPANIEWEVNGDRVAALRNCLDYCKKVLQS